MPVCGEDGYKVCSKCRIRLLATEHFQKNRQTADGLNYWCNACFNAWCSKRKAERRKIDVVFRMGLAIKKRQARGTHFCDLIARREKEKREADAKLEAKILRLQARGKHVCSLSQRPKHRRVYSGTPSTAEIEYALYRRIRSHVKKRTRAGRCAFTLTKKNAVTTLAWTARALRCTLEARFPVGYSWLDFMNGHLVLDHRIPSKVFDLSTLEGFRECYALDNLQLLTPAENANKSRGADRYYIEVFSYE